MAAPLIMAVVLPDGRLRGARTAGYGRLGPGWRTGLIAVGFGVSMITESDNGANFSGLTYRELRRGESR